MVHVTRMIAAHYDWTNGPKVFAEILRSNKKNLNMAIVPVSGKR